MKKYITTVLCVSLTAAALTSCSTAKTDTAPETSPTDSQSSVDSSSGEKRDEIVITLAMAGNAERMGSKISAFNLADNGYHIEVRQDEVRRDENGSIISYNDEEGHYKDLETLQGLTNKADIDIVGDVSFHDPSFYEILKNKGAFADLYTFMADDPEVNTDTLDNHILKLNEINGMIYSIPELYTIETLYGEKKYVGTTENWTFDEFLEHWNAMPEGSTISGAVDKEWVYSVVLRGDMGRFIDYRNAEVHFDSPEFKRILEFCDQFPQKVGIKSEYDYDAPCLLKSFYTSAVIGAHMFSSESDYTFVGYPTESRNGAVLKSAGYSLSISAASSPEKQKGAWEFLRMFLTEESQIKSAIIKYPEGAQEMGFCVNKKAFDAIAKGIIDHEYYPKTIKDDEGEEHEMQFPTEADVAAMHRYIESVDRWGTDRNGSMIKILNEETGEYFAGEITIDQCIDRIQNRASIWISEQA